MLSEEERQLVEKDRHRVCERQRRQNMTEEQRFLERERRRLRDEQRRKSMSDEQRSLEKERRRIRERERRNNMSDEQRAEEMERRRIREREHRQNMDDEQRARDRERRRLRDKERRENMTEEQRAQERERRRLYEEQKRGIIVNGQLVVSRKRRGPTHQIRNDSNLITGVEQDNNFASNSSDATNGYQIHAPGEDHLEAEMSNTSERSSTITLDPNESAVVAGNVHHVVTNQNSLYSADVFGGNLISAPKQDNLNLEVTNTSESSSTTTLDLSKNTMVVFEDNHAVGDQSALYFTEDTDADHILALTRDNLEMGLTNMSECISSTIQGLDKMTELVSSGHETIGAHVNERNVLCADEQSRYDSKKITSLEAGKEVSSVNA